MFWEEDHRGTVSVSSYHIKGHTISMTHHCGYYPWSHWWRCLSAFFTTKLFFSVSLSILYLRACFYILRLMKLQRLASKHVIVVQSLSHVLKHEVFTINQNLLGKEWEEVSLHLYQQWEWCFLLTHKEHKKKLIW